jgi:pimeloyl-ACP methyl ester carboxylesterase
MRDLTLTSHDGIELAVRDHGGDGPAVLLLHGATRNLEDWRGVLRHLRGLRVVSMDQRFHGHSGVGPPTKPSDWVRDIETVIERLNLTETHVVGWSLGGLNALLYAAEHPECPAILDIDGYDVRQPNFYDELPPDLVREFLAELDSRSTSFVPSGDEGDDEWHDEQVMIFKRMDSAWGVDPEITDAVARRAFVEIGDARWARRPPTRFWTAALADGWTVDALDAARQASCPVTIVVCTRSEPVPAGHAATDFLAVGKRGVERYFRAVAEERPNVTVKTMDATHGVIHERPEEIAELIMAMARS